MIKNRLVFDLACLTGNNWLAREFGSRCEAANPVSTGHIGGVSCLEECDEGVFDVLYLQPIHDIVRLGIASGFIRNEPHKLNLMLVADPEAGKTSVLMDFTLKKQSGIYIFTDMTKSVLEKFLMDLKNNPQQVRCVIVPDFTRIFGHGQKTQKGIVGLLNSGMEEGVHEANIYQGGVSQTVVFDKPVVFGLITSVTKYYFSDVNRVRSWKNIGFTTRFLPISYSYTSGQQDKIRDFIAEEKDLFEEPERLRLKDTSVHCAAKYLRQLDPEVKMLAFTFKMLGFRYMKQFRIMLKSHALLRGAKAVEQADVDKVKKLLRYVNLDFNVLLEENDGHAEV